MRKKILISTFVFAAAMIISYLLISFIKWDMNIITWKDDIRLLIVATSLSCAILSIAYQDIFKT